MNLFVSTAIYALSKTLGMAAAAKHFQEQLANPNSESLPVVKAIHRLRQLADVFLHLDAGGTVIGKSRSRAFHAALQSPCEAWISIDDDLEATTDTLCAMLEALNDPRPRVVVVPYTLRGPEAIQRTSVALPLVRTTTLVNGVSLVDLPHPASSGFGLVGMNRSALDRIAEHNREFWRDEDGVTKLAVFHDVLDAGVWWGEDLSFFRRVPETVPVGALLTGVTCHDGLVLPLEKL